MAKEKRLDRIERALERLEQQAAQTSVEVGKVANGLGVFAEGLVAPSIPRILKKLGIAVDGHSTRVKRRLGGESREHDILAVGRRVSGPPVVVVFEVSTQLLVRDVDWCVEKLPRFFEFFPEYAGYDLLAGVAGMEVHESVGTYAERQGLYVLGPGEEFARVLNQRGFQPKVWRASPATS